MPHLLKKSYILAFCAAISILSGCGTTRRMSWPWEYTYFPVSGKNTGFTKEYPHSFTVYPFKNLSWYSDAGERARREVYAGFSLIGRCAQMDETDNMASVPYNLQDAFRVAKKQDSEAVIIGEVEKQENSFLILYAYNYVELKITIYDTNTKKILWSGCGWSISNEFGGLIFWIPNPILPMIENIFWSRVTMSLYHKIVMDTVSQLRPDIFDKESPDRK